MAIEENEFASFLDMLTNKQSIRNLHAEFEFTPPVQEESDLYDLAEIMGTAYEGLAHGIHDNVQAWHASRGREPLIRKVITPRVYINGSVTQTKIEFLLSSHNFDGRQKQPDYIESYLKARRAVYEELLQHALNTSDFGPLLSSIGTYEESVLAQRLLNELSARKQRYPDMIIGNANAVLGRIDRSNRRIYRIKQSSQNYASMAARREFRNESYRKLNSDETGIIGALALGAKIKINNPGSKSERLHKFFIDPLSRIAKLQTVPERLIAREIEGLPITDADK